MRTAIFNHFENKRRGGGGGHDKFTDHGPLEMGSMSRQIMPIRGKKQPSKGLQPK